VSHSGRVRLSLLVMAMLSSDMVRAGVWGADPSIGVSGDYGSNPGLLELPHTAQTDAALLIDSPVSYQSDALTLSLLPSLRLSDTRSYTSLNSNYVHLRASGEFDSERNTLKMTVGATRDSSLYQNYLVNGESAVRRDGLTGELAYTRHLTERLDTDLDVTTQRVRYGTPVGNASLVDYNYTTVAPDLSLAPSERDRLILSASGGQYESADRTTRSRNLGAQLEYRRSLSEIWSLDASAGYSRQQNRLTLEVPEIVFIPGYGFTIIEVPVGVESQVSNPVYSLRLTRSGPRLTLNLSATRQEVPTGFAFLSRQTAIDLQLNYSISPRWSAGLHEYRLRAQDPSLQGGGTLDRDVNSLTVSATYQLSEQLNLNVELSRIGEKYAATDLTLTNNQVTLTFNYKFNHISLQ
jgi:hypothetical protein